MCFDLSVKKNQPAEVRLNQMSKQKVIIFQQASHLLTRPVLMVEAVKKEQFWETETETGKQLAWGPDYFHAGTLIILLLEKFPVFANMISGRNRFHAEFQGD